MRAVTFDRFGEPGEILTLRTKEQPRPGPGEVVVRVVARPVNPSDLIPVRGAYRHRTRLPGVPGFEGVGTVVAAADDVDELPVGTRVLPLRGEGTWQEYVRVPAAWCVPVPGSIPDEDASQLYVNPLTAWLILTEVLRLRPGDTLVANAGGSAFVHVLAQLARLLEIRVVAVVRSAAPVPRLGALGLHAAVDASSDDEVRAVLALTSGRGADAALDAVGGEAGARLSRCLAEGGSLVHYGLLSGEPLALTPEEVAARSLSVRGFWLRGWVHRATPARFRDALARVVGLVAAGRVAMPPVEDVYDLAGVREAVRAAERAGRAGKVLLTG